MIELMPFLLVGLEVSLLIVAVVFFVSGLDDFLVEAIFLTRSLYRRLFVLPKHERLTEAHLRLPDEQPIAVMVAAWDEGAVIGSTLDHAVFSLDYANYQIFVGSYPNDERTAAAVAEVATRTDHVQSVICPHEGPTCKADCLNWIFRSIEQFERDNGTRFSALVIHDAEDILHPLSLKLFNYLIPRRDMVQLPVLPLETEWYRFTAGHYLDEFSENHTKDLLVREQLSHVVPCAGVGCAFSRDAFDRITEANDGELFRLGSLTEDYDFAFRLGELGASQIFVHQAIERSQLVKNRLTGKTRAVTVRESIATREYFPRTLRTAVRQKSRWVIGIVLQGWANLGWRGSKWTKYMLLRDRKSLVTHLVNMLGYVVLIGLLALWIAPKIWPEVYRYPPLVRQGTWLWALIIVDTAFLGTRLVARAAYVGRLYGWRQALLSMPRQLWGNIINFFAAVRALYLWAGHLQTGRPLGWDKTDHAVPDLVGIRAYRRKLGDLLVARRHITRVQLGLALERQGATGLPLGVVLVQQGLVEEDTVIQALGTQLQLSTEAIDPYQTPLELLAVLPRELAVRYSVYPVRIGDHRRLELAMDRVLERHEVEEIEEAIDRPVSLCLSTRSDLSFAIRRGYERLNAEITDQAEHSLLGQRLLARGLITPAQLVEALRSQRRSYVRLGDVLLEAGLLQPETLEQAVAENARVGGRLGEFLVQHEYLSLEDLGRALEIQRRCSRRLGEVLVELETVTKAELNEVIEETAA